MKWRYQAPSLQLILAQAVLTFVHVHLLVTIVHAGPINLTGLTLTRGHLIGLTGVIHLDMTIMTKNPSTGLVVTNETTRVEMTALDTTITGMAGQTAFLHSVKTDATTTMLTILHLVNNGKVKDSIMVKTRVIIIHVVIVEILSINEVTEARTETIANIITTHIVTSIVNPTASHTMGLGRTLNQTTLLKHPLYQICLAL